MIDAVLRLLGTVEAIIAVASTTPPSATHLVQLNADQITIVATSAEDDPPRPLVRIGPSDEFIPAPDSNRYSVGPSSGVRSIISTA